MIDLKNVFTGECDNVTFKLQLDFSNVNVNGSYIEDPLDVDLLIENHAGLVSMSANVVVGINTTCDRCATDMYKKYKYSFSHVIVPSLSENMPCDYVEAKDFNLDIYDVIMSDVLLELPTKFLCKDTCKGICPNCGKNLNEGNCKCHKGMVDPRFEILRQLID